MKLTHVQNVLVILLMLAFLVSLTGIASAGASGEKVLSSGSSNPEFTTVIFSHQSETYKVTIPAEIRFDETAPVNQVIDAEVNATGIVLDASRKLIVNASSEQGWNLTRFTTSGTQDTYYPADVIQYTLEYNLNSASVFQPATSGKNVEFIILSAETGVRNVITPLKFTKVGTPPTTGQYKDLITFTAGIFPVA